MEGEAGSLVAAVCREKSPNSLNSTDTTERDAGMLLHLRPAG
jgi:hypothetical protein